MDFQWKSIFFCLKKKLYIVYIDIWYKSSRIKTNIQHINIFLLIMDFEKIDIIPNKRLKYKFHTYFFRILNIKIPKKIFNYEINLIQIINAYSNTL